VFIHFPENSSFETPTAVDILNTLLLAASGARTDLGSTAIVVGAL